MPKPTTGGLGSAGGILPDGTPGDGTPMSEGASAKGSLWPDGASVPPSEADVGETGGVRLVRRSLWSPGAVEGWIASGKYEGGSGKAGGVPRYDVGYNTSMMLLVEGNERRTCLRGRDLGRVRV